MQGQIVVVDSSVVIDLERGGFLGAAFSLQFDFCVPDLLYEQELRAYGGEMLLEYGLKTKVLSDAEVLQAEHYRRTACGLSRPDTFLLTLALKLDCMLLSGDALLRQNAIKQDIECHGVLWLLDRMLEARTATPEQLHDGLIRILDHPDCRLPEPEVKTRLLLFLNAQNGGRL